MSRPFSINPQLATGVRLDATSVDDDIFATIPGGTIRSRAAQLLGNRVQPGDLITADLINSILARLDALESRPVPTPTVPSPTTFPTRPTTFPTFEPSFTFPTIFTIDPTMFTRPTGPVFTIDPTMATRPTGPVFTFVPTLTMGPTGMVFTQVPAFTMGPGNVATAAPTGAVATGLGNLATAATGLGNLGGSIGGLGLTGGGAIRREDSVRTLSGVGREEETRLTNAGITNLGAVADADPVVLGTTLGVQPEEAARVIGNVRGALGRPR